VAGFQRIPWTEPVTQLTIVADIRTAPGKAELVRAELLKLIAPTQAEAGCLVYDLHVDNDDPNHFLFYETWESRALWQDHMGSTHLADFGQATEGAVERLDVYEMTNTRAG